MGDHWPPSKWTIVPPSPTAQALFVESAHTANRALSVAMVNALSEWGETLTRVSFEPQADNANAAIAITLPR